MSNENNIKQKIKRCQGKCADCDINPKECMLMGSWADYDNNFLKSLIRKGFKFPGIELKNGKFAYENNDKKITSPPSYEEAIKQKTKVMEPDPPKYEK